MVITGILEYLHGQKPPVYYGDLKPDNLMLSDSGKLYLVDLEVLCLDTVSFRKTVWGQRAFAAPEQYEGKMDTTSDNLCPLEKNIRVSGREKLVQDSLADSRAFSGCKKMYPQKRKNQIPKHGRGKKNSCEHAKKEKARGERKHKWQAITDIKDFLR